jgi:ubiquinone/menaquinone biosynthesis C-methylase UbiE
MHSPCLKANRLSIPDTSSSSVYNFDRVAEEYEATRFIPVRIAERIAEQVTRNMSSEDWLLEAGIGTGRIGRALLRQHPRTAGIDISQAMLRYLQTAYSDGTTSLPLALADVRALPFAADTFQSVLAVHVLHLVAEWERALREMWRVLSVGGKLILGVEDRTASAIRDYFFARAAQRNALPTTTSGAHSSQVVAALRERGVAVEERRLPELGWTRSISAAETLDLLQRRTYSLLWEMPDSVLNPLLEETRRWTMQQYGRSDLRRIVEAIDFQMVLFIAVKEGPLKAKDGPFGPS